MKAVVRKEMHVFLGGCKVKQNTAIFETNMKTCFARGNAKPFTCYLSRLTIPAVAGVYFVFCVQYCTLSLIIIRYYQIHCTLKPPLKTVSCIEVEQRQSYVPGKCLVLLNTCTSFFKLCVLGTGTVVKFCFLESVKDL